MCKIAHGRLYTAVLLDKRNQAVGLGGREAAGEKGTLALPICARNLNCCWVVRISYRIASYLYLSLSPLWVFHFFLLTRSAMFRFSVLMVATSCRRRKRVISRVILPMEFRSLCKMVQVPWASPKHCCAAGFIWAVIAARTASPLPPELAAGGSTAYCQPQVPELCSLCSLQRGAVLTAHPESWRIR